MERYVEIEIEIVAFDTEDVIVTSNTLTDEYSGVTNEKDSQ